MLRLTVTSVCLYWTISAVALPAPELAGRLEGDVQGKPVVLAALTSHYQVQIAGDLASVTLTQTFSNPYRFPLNARYLFPLNSEAAVHAMEMEVGDERISAQIQERAAAERTFERAREEGRAAALLEQHRPNLFTQQVANLMPGADMRIRIHYTQTVPRIDGGYELVVPLVAGPRFQPAGAGVPPAAGPARFEDGAPSPAVPVAGADATPASEPLRRDGEWELNALPAYPPVQSLDVPELIDPDRVSLSLQLETPVALHRIHSTTHDLAIVRNGETRAQASFTEGRVIDNRDLVVRYELSGAALAAGLLSHFEPEEGGYFSLLIEPPARVADSAVLPREMVFLLDCSGSMNGLPMAASKAFMRQALSRLRPADHFRIIRFSDSATEFANAPLPATAANIARGLRYTENLSGSGGTMMTSGIRQALSGAAPAMGVRNVIFLTDGYIGNEAEVLRLVTSSLGDARLYAFGVGAGVNRYLLDELGRMGRGFTRYFDPTRADAEALETVARELADRLQTPVLTDLSIDWGELDVQELAPRDLPDLYAGQSIRVSGRFTTPAGGDIVIQGRMPGKAARLARWVQLEQSAHRPAVRRIWARQAVAERMHDLITPPPLRPPGRTDDTLKQEVTELGLRYALVTRWTSFVAVSEKVVNSGSDSARHAEVTLPKVAGLSHLAYPQAALTGFGAPEPGLFAGLFTGFGVWCLLRQRRRQRLARSARMPGGSARRRGWRDDHHRSTGAAPGA